MAWKAAVVFWAIAAVLILGDNLVQASASDDVESGALTQLVGYFMAGLGTISSVAQLMFSGNGDNGQRRRRRRRRKRQQ